MSTNRREVTLPIIGRVGISFYCLSTIIYKLYEKTNEFERQKGIKHLGLISNEFEGVSHSRYEYLMLQCATADLFDYIHKGTSSTQGAIAVDGKKYKGNGLLKSWYMLSNFGHTKNTFGDEKSLSLFIKSNKEYRARILSSIKDKSLRSWSRDVIDGFKYHKFHYVISIWRIYKEQKRNVDEKELCLMALKLLLLDYNDLTMNVDKGKLSQLRQLFKKIRDTTIVSIDGHYSHTPVSVDLISSIMSFDLNSKSDLFNSINDIRSHLHEEIYLDKNVLARQRSYEIDSLDYIKSNPYSATYFDEITSKAIHKGLVEVGESNLKHFCRCVITKDMQPDTSYYDELRNITIKVRRKCKSAQCSLDTNPFNGNRYVDFYLDKNTFSKSELPPFLFSILQLIDDQITHLIGNVLENYHKLLNEVDYNIKLSGIDENISSEIIEKSSDVMVEIAWDSISKYIFPLFRNLLWSCLNYYFDSKYVLEISQAHNNYKAYSIGTPDSNDIITMDINSAIKNESDLGRKHELNQLKKSALKKYSGYKIASLERINIIDPSLPPERRVVTDIDSVLLKISENELILELFEAKSGKGNSEGKAIKELRKNVAPTLSKSHSNGYRIRPVKNMGAKIVIKS